MLVAVTQPSLQRLKGVRNGENGSLLYVLIHQLTNLFAFTLAESVSETICMVLDSISDGQPE